MPSFLLAIVMALSFCCSSSLCSAKAPPSPQGTIPEVRTLLITGCARSGTAFVARFFKLQGYDLAHEREGSFGIVSWTMATDTTTTPWGPGSHGYIFAHTFHQVRDPLKTIASVSNEPIASWLYIQQFIPEISLGDPPLVNAAKYWYYWNLMAEAKAEWTYKIEDFPDLIGEMGRRLEISLDPYILKLLPTSLNTRRYKNSCSWKDLRELLDEDLFYHIVEMAIRYGYSVEEENL